jgi:hypothetical protein
MSGPEYLPEVERFARLVIRRFPQWRELNIREEWGTDPDSWYRFTVESPTRDAEGALAVLGRERELTVSWRGWSESFQVSSLDQKDVEFVQMLNLLEAIVHEEAVLVEEFNGEQWVRSTIHAVKDDGQLGAAGSRIGAPRLAFWRSPTRSVIRSWKGSLDSG